jgi:hypothetical protein
LEFEASADWIASLLALLAMTVEAPHASWPGIAVRRTASLRSAYDPAIHVFLCRNIVKTWMRGSSPRMTNARFR